MRDIYEKYGNVKAPTSYAAGATALPQGRSDVISRDVTLAFRGPRTEIDQPDVLRLG